MSADELLVAWAAGFFDGEGTVGIQLRSERNGGGYVMQMAVYQKHPEPLFRFHEITECGSVHVHKKSHISSSQWLWRASGRQALGVLERLRPHLVAKREQADVAIDFQRRRIQCRADRMNKAIAAKQRTNDEVDREMLKALKHIPFVDVHPTQQ